MYIHRLDYILDIIYSIVAGFVSNVNVLKGLMLTGIDCEYTMFHEAVSFMNYHCDN